ncbi:GSCOCG00005289001-RA-CDS, partial [Cotesia congregata]
KVFESIIANQVVEYLEENNLLDKYQSGFRKFHSTQSALLKVTEDIRCAIDRGELTLLVLFDLSKAFDYVNPKVILVALFELGFSIETVTWFLSYLLVTIDAQGIADWAKDHGLQVNLNKTKSLIIGSNSKLKSLNIDSLPPIIINNVPLPYVSQTKCLGLSLNNDLLWKNYVSQTVRKVNAALYTLKTRMNIYTTAIRKLLVTATILLLIDYCTVVLIDATADNNLKLQRALNSSIRFIYNLKRDEHITPYRRKLNWLSVKSRRLYYLITYYYKLLQTG